jgi:hypothetical protein
VPCDKTQKEADDAAAHANQMLANTIFLTGMGDESPSSLGVRRFQIELFLQTQ